MEDLLSCDAKQPDNSEDNLFDETFYEFCVCKKGNPKVSALLIKMYLTHFHITFDNEILCISSIIKNPVYDSIYITEREDVPMTRCSNPTCPMGLWFHLDCLGLCTDDIPKGNLDWWCTPKCRSSGSSIYCICKLVVNGVDTVTCANNCCPNGEKFHLSCLHIASKPRN